MQKSILEEIYKSIEKFLYPLTLEQTSQIIVKEGTRLVGATYGAVILRKGNSFETIYSSRQTNKPRTAPRKRGFAYQAYKTHKIIIIKRKQAVPYHPELKDTDTKALAFIPLSHDKESIGVIVLQFNRPNPLVKEQLKVLKIYGSLASLAIRKIQYYNEVKNTLETRDLFISLASHELRTPLTSIQIYAQLIQRKLAKTTEAQKLSEGLLGASQRLTKLIDEFLQIDQIKAGKLQYYWSEQKLSEILKQAIIDFQIVNPNHALNYQEKLDSNPDTILADQSKLLQAINNLLNNAAKFSPKGSEISLSLTHKEPNLIITIKDQGEGIKKKDLSKIFESFYKGSSNKQGLGLGLYLTKEIILKHHGDIKVQSKIGKGTTFIINIPPKHYAYQT